MVRVIIVARHRTCGPSTEPEPCPLDEGKLTEKRVTISYPQDGTDRDRKTMIDVWKDPDTGDPVDNAILTQAVSDRLWTGEIIFEMNQEEKD